MPECRKTSHKTLAAANMALADVTVLNMSKGKVKKNKTLHTYYCKPCKAYHVGHDTPREIRSLMYTKKTKKKRRR